jgi:hypothetical protein
MDAFPFFLAKLSPIRDDESTAGFILDPLWWAVRIPHLSGMSISSYTSLEEFLGVL